MAIRDVLRCAVLLAACLALPAQGQRLVVLRGAAAAGSTASAFIPDPFATGGAINAAPGAFLAFSNLDGSRFFIVTTTGVVVVDSAGAQVQAPLAIAQVVKAAALSANGQRLVVVAGDSTSGAAYVFDTSGTTASQIAAIDVGANPLDVAIAADSAAGYVLRSGALVPLDLTANTAGAAVGLAASVVGTARPGVAVGPNGLVYVNTQSVIYELDPTTLAQLNTVALTGFPGKLTFYSDGKSAVAANQLSGSPAAVVMDLFTHEVTNTLTFQFPFDKLFYVSPSLVYALSTASGYLYSFSPASPSPTFKVASISSAGGIKAATASSEAGAPQFLFLVRSSSVTRIDLTATPPASVTANLSTPPGPAFYLGQVEAGMAASIAQFNGIQTVAPGGWSLPLVVRLLDSTGNPVPNQTVRWSVPSTVTLRNAMTSTNSQGYATAFARMPSTLATYSVTAQFPNSHIASQSFRLTVGSGTTPGGDGGGTPTAGISIVSGNGQVVRGGYLTLEPMVVSVADTSGKPMANVPVTFSLGATFGNLVVNSADLSQSNCSVVATGTACRTDSRGLASINYIGVPVNDLVTSYAPSTITASAPQGSVAFTVTSVPATVGGTGSAGPLPNVRTITPAGINAQFTGQAGQTLKGAIQVQVAALLSGVNIPNVGLSVRPTLNPILGQSSPAYCAGSGHTALTNAQGLASCDLVLGSQPGTYTLYRVVGGYDTAAVYTVTITAPAPVVTTVQATGGNNQTGPVGQAFPNKITAVVKDQFGKVMPNVPVTWTVILGQANLTNQTAKSDTQGVVSANVTPTAAGSTQVRVTAGSASAVFQLTATVSITSLTKVSGDTQTAVTGAAFADPLFVQANSAQGPLANFPVDFTATAGATLSAASVNTNAQGQASVTVTAGPTAGPVQVTATAGGQSVTFNLTARIPGPQLTPASFVNGASFQPGFSFGSVVSIMATGLTTGLNLAPGTCLTDGDIEGLPATSGLPTRLGGVEFQFGSILAPIFAICKNADGTEQANVQAPFELAPAKISVTIRYGAGTQTPTTFSVGDIQILNAAPGIFEYMADASTKVAVATKADGSVISPSNPAHPGDTIQVYVTGLGPVLPHVSTNELGVPGQKPFFTPTATLGGTPMGGVTAEYAQNAIGIFVVTFQIPSGQAAGAAVPLTIGVVKNDKTTADSQTSQIAITAQ